MSSFSPTASLIGTALLYSGLQFALASCEMSSRFSVENFSKDQKTLQGAANALSTYIIIAIIWTVASCLVLYSDHGKTGIVWGLLTNMAFVGWIIISYWVTFRRASDTYGLAMPRLFRFNYNPTPLPRRI